LNQLNELLTSYGEIDYIWFDGWKWQVGYETIPYDIVRDFIRSLQPGCIVLENNTEHNLVNSDIVCFESRLPRLDFQWPYETCDRVIKDKWFWPGLPGADDLESTGHIVFNLGHIKLGNGSYLLNCSPDTSGLIPENQALLLREVRDSMSTEGKISIKDQPVIIARPNPFSGIVTFCFTVCNSSGHVELMIYDAAGRKIKQFNRLTYEPFNHIAWDGVDDVGNSVPSGIYFVRVKTDTYTATQKVLFIE
jgi:alpha-L-fucosidase